MENYRKKLKFQVWLNSIGALALLVVQVLAYVGVISPAAGGERWGSFWNGFIAGAALGVMLLFIITVIIYIRALHNEERLKKLYVKENDERTRIIYEKSRSLGSSIFLLGMIPAMIIAGYFSTTVFFTCLACALALSIVTVICKLYYGKAL